MPYAERQNMFLPVGVDVSFSVFVENVFNTAADVRVLLLMIITA